jgi:hypothetical protein
LYMMSFSVISAIRYFNPVVANLALVIIQLLDSTS